MAASKVEELKDRLIQMIDDGLTGWHFSPGPKWNSMTIEEKAGALLAIWDAPREETEPPKTQRTPMHLEDLVAELNAKGITP